MATSKEYLEFILEQLSLTEGVTHIPMMGGYIFYIRGRIFGGIYGGRFMLKPVPSAIRLMPNATLEPAYEGAKDMLLVEELENKELLRDVIEAMYDELPEPKPKKK